MRMATEAAIFPGGDSVFARLSTLKRDGFPCFIQLSNSDIGYRLRDVTRLCETRKKPPLAIANTSALFHPVVFLYSFYSPNFETRVAARAHRSRSLLPALEPRTKAPFRCSVAGATIWPRDLLSGDAPVPEAPAGLISPPVKNPHPESRPVRHPREFFPAAGSTQTHWGSCSDSF